MNETPSPARKHPDHPAWGSASLPVVTPTGVGDRGSDPGRYQLLSIGDGEKALFWVSE